MGASRPGQTRRACRAAPGDAPRSSSHRPPLWARELRAITAGLRPHRSAAGVATCVGVAALLGAANVASRLTIGLALSCTRTAHKTVQIHCRVQGFQVADGDTWCYQIAQSPWNDAYFGSADAFYNNGATSGSLIRTPFADTALPLC